MRLQEDNGRGAGEKIHRIHNQITPLKQTVVWTTGIKTSIVWELWSFSVDFSVEEYPISGKKSNRSQLNMASGKQDQGKQQIYAYCFPWGNTMGYHFGPSRKSPLSNGPGPPQIKILNIRYSLYAVPAVQIVNVLYFVGERVTPPIQRHLGMFSKLSSGVC